MIDSGQINAAEDKLFELIESGAWDDDQKAALILSFYDYLNGKKDDFLESAGFSRDEIMRFPKTGGKAAFPSIPNSPENFITRIKDGAVLFDRIILKSGVQFSSQKKNKFTYMIVPHTGDRSDHIRFIPNIFIRAFKRLHIGDFDLSAAPPCKGDSSVPAPCCRCEKIPGICVDGGEHRYYAARKAAEACTKSGIIPERPASGTASPLSF